MLTTTASSGPRSRILITFHSSTVANHPIAVIVPDMRILSLLGGSLFCTLHIFHFPLWNNHRTPALIFHGLLSKDCLLFFSKLEFLLWFFLKPTPFQLSSMTRFCLVPHYAEFSQMCPKVKLCCLFFHLAILSPDTQTRN